MENCCFVFRDTKKDDADFLLNLFKGGYHKRDIFMYKQLLKINDENPQSGVIFATRDLPGLPHLGGGRRTLLI